MSADKRLTLPMDKNFNGFPIAARFTPYEAVIFPRCPCVYDFAIPHEQGARIAAGPREPVRTYESLQSVFFHCVTSLVF
jgi:hypothetical protein